jgi:AcrR family transcriptional regulator
MAHQLRAEETKSKILTAAAICFARNGYDASSVSMICEEAGVTKGAFYYHFSTKQAIFLELINLWLSELDTSFNAIRHSSQTVPSGLMEMAKALGILFDHSLEYVPFFLEFWLHSIRDAEIWKIMILPYRRYQEYFAEIMQAGIDEGSFRPHDVNRSSRTLISTAIGLVLSGLIEPEEKTNWETSVQESVQVFLKGILV